MDVIPFSPNAMLIQGATMSDLESMMSRLLEKKLADIVESTPKVEESPKDGLYKRREAAKRLKISLVTLDKWTKIGIINARRIGTRVYYTDKDINDALKRVPQIRKELPNE
ncbi:MAG: helix-turn-helix domain-containing protein [Bacteroides sp.]